MSAISAPAMMNRRCMSERIYAISCALERVKVGITVAAVRRNRDERVVTGAAICGAIPTSVSDGRTGRAPEAVVRFDGRAGPRCLRRGPVALVGALRLESLNDGPPLRPSEQVN